jgi:hypothetical protein
MKTSRVLICVIGVSCMIQGSASAGSRSSANYSITTDTVDSGGVNAQSASYALYGSAAGEFGAGSGALITSAAYLDKIGYVGQLSDLLLLTSAVSRKTHGSDTFEINLPLSGRIGIECRTGPTSGNHQVIASFATSVTFSSASLAGGGMIPPGGVTVSGNQISITLNGVPSPARLFITLSSVSNGFDASDVVVPMDVLLGDANSTGRTDSGDVTAVRNHTVSIPDLQTFQFDVNASGRIDSGDVTVTRNASVTVLPP